LLLETHPRKGNVMAALEQWCSSEPNVVQAKVLARRSAFVDVVATTLDAEAVDVQVAVAKSLLGLCNNCRKLAAEVGQSRVLTVIVDNILQMDRTRMTELRVWLIKIVLSCYQASRQPKQMIARFRLLEVAHRLIDDESEAVRVLALQLLHVMVYNYIFRTQKRKTLRCEVMEFQLAPRSPTQEMSEAVDWSSERANSRSDCHWKPIIANRRGKMTLYAELVTCWTRGSQLNLVYNRSMRSDSIYVHFPISAFDITTLSFSFQ
jgi:hypothetical protein